MNRYRFEFIKNLKNNLSNIENILDDLFSNVIEQPITIENLITFATIYNRPLEYANIGIKIEKYDSFLEMISNTNLIEKNRLGNLILKYSYKYKLIQELNDNLLETYKILSARCKYPGFHNSLHKIFTYHQYNFEKHILETYYQYYLV
jgi:hypothetical protein